MILSLVVFNAQVVATGLTYIEFKNTMDWRIYNVNKKHEDQEQHSETSVVKPKSGVMKFHYGFSTTWENIVRVAKT
jgi:hypothetical protein